MQETQVITPDEFRESAAAITEQVGRVIVGQEEVIRHVLICVIAGGHTLLEGVPGLGKTMLIRALSDALDLSFSRVQFTPDLMPADITGTDILDENESGRKERLFQPGPIFANMILADEINRATPKTQSALLEAMQEKSVTVANETYTLDLPFFVMATQNPLEMEGTYPLPEAQLDRFMFKVDVGFPSSRDLVEILNRTTGDSEKKADPAADGEMIVKMGELTRKVPIATHVSEYVARLIVATHPDGNAPEKVRGYVRYGASPRGAQAIILGSKIHALLAGRYNVAFEDVKAVTPAALRHRLILNFEAQAEGVTADDVITDLLESVAPDF